MRRVFCFAFTLLTALTIGAVGPINGLTGLTGLTGEKKLKAYENLVNETEPSATGTSTMSASM
jgi:hypothetical protein